jgi:hypothetical protein
VCVPELEVNDGLKNNRVYIVGVFERGHQVPAEVALPDARRCRQDLVYAMAPCTGQLGKCLGLPVQHLRGQAASGHTVPP